MDRLLAIEAMKLSCANRSGDVYYADDFDYGMICGGLNGCPIQRSGCLHCTESHLALSPTNSKRKGNQPAQPPPSPLQLDLEIRTFGPFSWTMASESASFMFSRKAQKVPGCPFERPMSLGPSRLSMYSRD